MDRPGRVYKICAAAEWAAALASGAYGGSADDARDGYIHLSTAAQVGGVLDRYFKQATALVVITLETEALGAALKWEPNSKGEDFPHLYAALPAKAVLAVEDLPDDQDGRASFVRSLT